MHGLVETLVEVPWRGRGQEPRPVSVLLEEAAQVDMEARRLLDEAHDTLAAENTHLMGVKEVLEDRLRAAVALARVQHQR